MELYKKLIYWELRLEDIEDSSMFEILESQKIEGNNQFGKFVEQNYQDWFSDPGCFGDGQRRSGGSGDDSGSVRLLGAAFAR